MTAAFQLPLKPLSKVDSALLRRDCGIIGMQMSVPQEDHDKIQRRDMPAEMRRRRNIIDLRDSITKRPSDYSEALKLKNEIEFQDIEKMDNAAASGFSLVNHDFIIPFGWNGHPKTDALISNVLHLLRSKHVSFLPSCIAFVLDNASVNKSQYILHAFALLLELIPLLKEVHLLFPTVGHTHNSLDAHFGAICNKIRGKEVGTPSGTAFHFIHDISTFFSLSHSLALFGVEK